MRPERLVQSLFFTGSIVVSIAIPVRGENIFSPTQTGDSRQGLPLLSKTQLVEPSRVQQLRKIREPSTNAQTLLQHSRLSQAGVQVVQVTGVRVNPTDKGVEIILETPLGKRLQVSARSDGNTYTADIPNAQLRLPNSDAFRQEQPVAGIAEIAVTNQDANTIRMTVKGEASLPQVESFTSAEGLIFGLATAVSSTQQLETEQTPAQKLESETPAEKPSVETDEEEIVVTGEQDEYLVPNATAGTRTDTPLRDIPQSVQVIPQEVIEDQQVIRLEEALRNASSFIYGGTDTTTEANYIIRGFERTPVLQDGFRQYNLPEVPEAANLERIEILKGPASILFGEIQPGGVINTVTKKPLSEPFYEAEFQAGSYDLVRPRIDISGPLTTDGNLLYRLNALYLDSESFRNYDRNIERFFIAPALTWKIGDRTDITFELEYADSERPFDTDGTVAVGEGIADIPRDRILNEPDDYIERDFFKVGYNLEHRFNDNWTLRNAFRYLNSSVFSDKLTIASDFDEATGILNRVYAYDDFDSEDYSLQTNVVGKFNTGTVEHTLLFGVDLNRSNSSNFVRVDFFNPTPIDIFNPVYGTVPRPASEDLPLAQDTETETDRVGIYLQDQIALFDNLKLLAGLRFDSVNQEATNAEAFFTPTGADPTQNSDAWSPRVGIVYQPIPEISLYASYSQSFTPNTSTGLTASGELLEPEKGEGYEVGIKAELLEGGLFATLAYFDITKQNVASTDPNFIDLGGVFVATGEQRSRGVELDVTGRILPGWNIIASYAHTDAEITEDNVFEIGNRLVGVPKNSASLWTTYEIQSGSLQGLGFGIGFNYVGEREGDLDNSFELDSYFLTNAAIFYRRENWRFALNFKNLFDTDYIVSAPSSRVARIAPGEPFTVVGSISLEF
ncbi:TonB-dependent receptor [Chroococcidiopsis sp. FACHB-1243]|uniref:TonB-dependent receptor n=1 Tax=Chroococcidiopsis sp. [FACHB-1243] TaxID=2692781 RepID=UPI00177DC2E0|nr:TonB-dependent receptor [Chroococcidiopsis sp. [FACHB-1243]]MBD2309025.1 TonB-dependent receptor [Chroococcidiopsis sp. [FACHB-1243]]